MTDVVIFPLRFDRRTYEALEQLAATYERTRADTVRILIRRAAHELDLKQNGVPRDDRSMAIAEVKT